MSRWTAVLAVAGLAAAGCGGSYAFPEHRPQDYPPIKTTVLNAPFGLEPGAAAAFDLDLAESGDLYATVDWTSSANNVVAVFSSPRCASVNLALAGSCAEGVHATRPSVCPAKPRIVTASVVAGARVRLYVANAGTSLEWDGSRSRCAAMPPAAEQPWPAPSASWRSWRSSLADRVPPPTTGGCLNRRRPRITYAPA